MKDSWTRKPDWKAAAAVLGGLIVALALKVHLWGMDPDGLIFPRVILACVVVIIWSLGSLLLR